MKTKRLSIKALQLEVLPLRTETLGGERHIVAPVVMLVEGVHNDLLYPATELAKFTEAWNGRPVVIFHPTDGYEPVSANTPELVETQTLGQLFNTAFVDGKLKAEMWLSEQKLEKIAPEVLALLRGSQRLEVSTGLFLEYDEEAGEWNGDRYESTAYNYRPDHLALLPGTEGACNWEDGCGVRVNADTSGVVMTIPGSVTIDDNWKDFMDGFKDAGEVTIPMICTSAGPDQPCEYKLTFLKANGKQKKEGPMSKVGALVSAWTERLKAALKDQDVSHEDLRSKLSRALDSLDNGEWIHFVYNVFDDVVVYEARSNNPNVSPGNTPVVKLYKRGYSVGEDEVVTLAETAEEVREETRFVPVTNMIKDPPDTSGWVSWSPEKVTFVPSRVQPNAGTGEARKMEDNAMAEMKERVAALVACDCNGFGEGDIEWLTALEEEQFARLETLNTKALERKKDNAEDEEEEAPAPEGDGTPANEEEAQPEPAPQTVEEYAAKAPPEVAETLQRMIAVDRATKDELVKALAENSQCSFTLDELRVKGMAELEKLVELARVKVDFSGQSGGPVKPGGPATNEMPKVFSLERKRA